MARRVKISSGILNVRLHPHPPGIYGRFIEQVYALRKPIQVWGDRYAVISLLNRSEASSGIYTGLITAFTRIDTSEPWFNTASLSEASKSDISNISIPNGLYPNPSTFNFLFDTNHHRLYVQTYSAGKTFSIGSARRLFSGLADDLRVVELFNEAKINIVQSRQGLENVFSLPIIKRVIITITKPNADVFDDDFDENVEDFLEELNSQRLTLIVESEPRKSVEPNASLRRISQFALEHGSVKVEGRDQRGAAQRSTDEFASEIHDKYDPENTSENLAFRQLAGR